MFVVLRTLELLPVNVALPAFIRIPLVRMVARPVLQKGQPWAWVLSPLLNAFVKLASLKLGPWMLVLLKPTNHRFVGSFFTTCQVRVVRFYVGLISSSSFSSSSTPHTVRRCARKTVRKNASSSPPLLLPSARRGPSAPSVHCRTSLRSSAASAPCRT